MAKTPSLGVEGQCVSDSPQVTRAASGMDETPALLLARPSTLFPNVAAGLSLSYCEALQGSIYENY